MSDIILLGLINLGLVVWVYRLHKKHDRTIFMMHDIFEGIYHKKVEIVKFNDIYVPKPADK